MSEQQTTATEATETPEKLQIAVPEKIESEEMTLEEMRRIEHEIQTGIRTTMPDGTPIENVYKNLIAKQKEQADRVKQLVPSVEEAKQVIVEVTSFTNGAISATAIGEKIEVVEPIAGESGETQEPDNDLPNGFPGRSDLIAAGHVSLEKIAAYSFEELRLIPGIGKATAEKILAYGKPA